MQGERYGPSHKDMKRYSGNKDQWVRDICCATLYTLTNACRDTYTYS